MAQKATFDSKHSEKWPRLKYRHQCVTPVKIIRRRQYFNIKGVACSDG